MPRLYTLLVQYIVWSHAARSSTIWPSTRACRAASFRAAVRLREPFGPSLFAWTCAASPAQHHGHCQNLYSGPPDPPTAPAWPNWQADLRKWTVHFWLRHPLWISKEYQSVFVSQVMSCLWIYTKLMLCFDQGNAHLNGNLIVCLVWFSCLRQHCPFPINIISVFSTELGATRRWGWSDDHVSINWSMIKNITWFMNNWRIMAVVYMVFFSLYHRHVMSSNHLSLNCLVTVLISGQCWHFLFFDNDRIYRYQINQLKSKPSHQTVEIYCQGCRDLSGPAFKKGFWNQRVPTGYKTQIKHTGWPIYSFLPLFYHWPVWRLVTAPLIPPKIKLVLTLFMPCGTSNWRRLVCSEEIVLIVRITLRKWMHNALHLPWLMWWLVLSTQKRFDFNFSTSLLFSQAPLLACEVEICVCVCIWESVSW